MITVVKFGGSSVASAEQFTKVKNIVITDVYRKESLIPVETVHVGENTEVDSMILENILTENHTGQSMPMLSNEGRA